MKASLPQQIWVEAIEAEEERLADLVAAVKSSAEIYAMVAAREAARANKDWQTADSLRDQIIEHGWQVKDSPEGSELIPLAN